MKTLKTIGIACLVMLASVKMFAQTVDKQTPTSQKAETVQPSQPAVDEDPVMTFFKQYQAYIESKKEKPSLPARSNPSLGATQGYLVNSQAISQAYNDYLKDLRQLPAGTANGEITRVQMLATQANLNYLDARTNNQMAATAPAAGRPAEPSLKDKEQMLKKALAEKEKLDRQNAEKTIEAPSKLEK